jgi:hypothetical protein
MTSHPAARPTDVGPWRTSSYSGNGENCVEVAPWRTSSHSGRNSDWVAPSASGVLLRDSKDHGTGPVLIFTTAQWVRFLDEIRSGGPSANGAVVVSGTTVRAVADDPVLHFTADEWAAFREGVRDGEFDILSAA